MIHTNVVITEYKNRICTMLFRDNYLEELHVEVNESLLSDIYVAKVKNINKNINAAFVELFDGQMAFLPLEDVQGSPFLQTEDGKLREGDELPVQVIKEGVKTKDPVVTTKLSINGAYAVVTLDKRKGGFQYSKKLSNKQKQSIKDTFIDCLVPNDFAVVIRTGAGNLTDHTVLQKEVRELLQQMEEILLYSKTRTCFSRIYQGAPSYIEYLHHISSNGYEEIVTDIPVVYNVLKKQYKGGKTVRFYEDAFPLKKLYSIETKMDELFAKKIYLKSGGTLFIEYTEAMTVIDINTGKCIAKKDKDTLNYQINLEAAQMIARHLRLRNISGIIVVDFINMEKEEYKLKLIQELKQLLKKDPVYCNYVDITALGLVEITRKKVQKPIYEVFHYK